jgi:uncharacterized metal-binding protein
MGYQEPGCAYCPQSVEACRAGEMAERGPGFCPTKVDPEGIDEARALYDDPEMRRIAQVSAVIESEGYCRWTRVEEACQFAKKMGFKRVGIATCISFLELAKTLSRILESHGLEVSSVSCKHGSIPKEEIDLVEEEKIRPGTYEPMCNPISQAQLLNRAGCQFNLILGLCIGHDSLFIKHSEGLVSTLVAKDRVLAHNPVGALHLADTYYSRVFGPEKPEKAPKIPSGGRR